MAAPTNGQLEFRLLGSIEVRRDDELIAVGGPRQRRLLAALALRANRVVSVDELIDVVFDGVSAPKGEHALHTYVSRLRSALGKEGATHVVTRPPGYMLDANGVSVDTLAFEDLAGRADRASEAGDPARALALADDALALWHGGALAEFAYEEWAQPDVKRLDEQRTLARERRIAARLALGAAAEVVPEIDRLVADQPLRDAPRALLMTALYRAGREADALRAYQQYRAYLADEAGLEPGAPLRLLERQILEQDPALRAPRPAGRELRGYRLVEQIGTGTFSTVHRAVQTSVGREVAIKIIRSELADNPTFIRLFDREAQLVARLEHPHIVPLHDYWREPGGAYLVMRLMRGGSAEDRLVERGPLTLPEVGQLVDEIGEALAVAHAQGVVHRDVKPGNVLFDENGHAYLGDFGIAADESLAGQSDGLTRSAGSPLYAAPEQIRDGRATAASDQYSLAALVWELLVAHPPFSEASVVGLLEAKCRGGVASVTAVRPDVPQAVDVVLRTATDPDPAKRFPDVGEMVLAFRSAVAQPGGVTTTGDPVIAGERPRARASRTLVSMRLEQQNPYKGLRAFHEADAADFFGRTRVVEDLLTKVVATRFVAVVGPSGVGKSSVVRAGLVPALRAGAREGTDKWFVATMTPGRDPFAELEVALVRVASGSVPDLRALIVGSGIAAAVEAALPGDESELLLVIDQFEELFTLCTDEERRVAFLNALVASLRAVACRLRVVLTLRADAYDRPLQYRAFAELIESGLVTVTVPASDELADAITGPAERVGVRVDPGLMAQLVADVTDRPSALPLLQYALTELYERRVSGVMTLDAYRAIGGLSGALANRADEVYEALPEPSRPVVRHLFTSLLVVGEGTAEPRRRVPVADVTGTSDDWIACARAIDQFGEQRLLSFDRDPATRNPTVEIAHEALLRCWPRLAQWIEDDRDDLRMAQALTAAATEWDAAGRDDADLVRGPRLAAAAGWADEHPTRLTGIQRGFLAAAQERSERELRMARRTTRRVRRIAVGLAVVLVASVCAVAVAVQQRNEASDAKRTVQHQADVAAASLLANRSGDLISTTPGVALALAAESIGIAPTAEATRVLLDGRAAMREQPWVTSALLLGHSAYINTVQFSPDGTTLVSASGDGTLRLWDVRTGTARGEPLRGHTSVVIDVAFSPDGRLLASGSGDGTVRLWDSATGAPVGAALTGHVGHVGGVAFSPDGRLLASAGDDGTVRLWDPNSGAVLDVITASEEQLYDVAFSPEGSRFVTSDSRGEIQVWDAGTRKRVGRPLHSTAVSYNIAVSATRLAWSGGYPVEYDMVAGVEIGAGSLAGEPIWNVAYSPDGGLLALAQPSGVQLRDSETMRSIATLIQGSGDGGIASVAFSPDGTLLAGGTWTGGIRLWARPPATSQHVLESGDGHINGVAYSSVDGWLAAGGEGGSVRLWDPDRAQLIDLDLDSSASVLLDVDVSSQGLVSATGDDGSVFVWDAATGTLLWSRLVDDGTVNAVAFSPDGRHLATGGTDGEVQLWDAVTGDLRGAFRTDGSTAVGDVAFSPDGGLLAVGTASGAVRMLDVDSMSPAVEGFVGHEGPVFAVTFSTDGHTLFTAGADHAVRRWDTSTGREAGSLLLGHTDVVFALAVDPTGEMLASGGGDGVIVWDSATGLMVGRLQSDTRATSAGGAVLGLAFRPDGRVLAAAENSGAVHLWDDFDPQAACALIDGFVSQAQVQVHLPEGREPHVCDLAVS